VGRRLRADIQYKRAGDGKEYADVTPIRARPADAHASQPVARDGAIDPNEVPW